MKPASNDRILTGQGVVHRQTGEAVPVCYTLHTSPSNGQATVAEFEPKPAADEGELVQLILEDGRILSCAVLDESPYCAVVGDGPIVERRANPRPPSGPKPPPV
jgi:hypothetical protein